MAVRKVPDDVGLFQLLILAENSNNGGGWMGLSEEQRETMERIDPGNGLYDFLLMKNQFMKAVGMTSSRSSASGTVSDEKAFAAALESFARAASAERFHDASGELKRQQLDSLPREREFLDQIVHTAFSEFIPSSMPRYRYYYSASADGLVKIHLIAFCALPLARFDDWVDG